VIFRVSDGSDEVDCAAYEPTGAFRRIVRALLPGDLIMVYAGVRELGGSLTLNVEKLEVTSLAEAVEYVNPRCPSCGGSMESMGQGQGYRCKKCGRRDRGLEKVPKNIPRDIKLGVYLPDRDAHRHLTKPLERYGREKTYVHSSMIGGWIGFTTRSP
jgi:tRNA(Ile2)-agmatinylcytidine synthase